MMKHSDVQRLLDHCCCLQSVALSKEMKKKLTKLVMTFRVNNSFINERNVICSAVFEIK